MYWSVGPSVRCCSAASPGLPTSPSLGMFSPIAVWATVATCFGHPSCHLLLSRPWPKVAKVALALEQTQVGPQLMSPGICLAPICIKQPPEALV